MGRKGRCTGRDVSIKKERGVGARKECQRESTRKATKPRTQKTKCPEQGSHTWSEGHAEESAYKERCERQKERGVQKVVTRQRGK